VDEDDPEKRIAELERQLADSIPPPNQHQAAGLKPAGWYPDPGGAAFLRYWDGHEWTSAIDEPPDDEPEGFAGPPVVPGAEPLAPEQPYPYSVADPGVVPEAPYERGPRVGKPRSDKNAVIAGVLQLLLGLFGAGRFYIGSMAIGACQLGLTIVCVVLAQVVASSETADELVGFLLIGLFLWAVIDAIRMFTGSVTDGQGRKLR
jgi:Protein of unknown function (DUF2510)/TM2 domain